MGIIECDIQNPSILFAKKNLLKYIDIIIETFMSSSEKNH